MDETIKQNGKRKFIQVIERNGRRVLTFLGVPANTILILFGIMLLVLNVAPTITLIEDSFLVHSGEVIPGYIGMDPFADDAYYLKEGQYTIYHWYRVFADETAVGFFYKPLMNSLIISVLSCAFAIIFGGMSAYLITRTNMPFKKFISAVFIFPYIMPQWTLALFWKNFFISDAFKGGYVGEFQHLFHIACPEWWVYGWLPTSIVLGLHYAPFAYILIGGVLRNMDANLEEAATILNIPKHKVFFHVTVPILKPALLSTILLVFSSAMSSYPVPITLKLNTLATQMKTDLQGSQGAYRGEGAIISILLILIGIVILMMNQVATSSRKQFTTFSGKSGQSSKVNLGKVGKWVIAVVLSICVVFFCIGPMISFFFESLLPNPGDYSSGFTFKYWISKDVIRNDYHGIFFEPKVWEALKGSVFLSFLCAILAGTIGLLIGYAVSKKRKSKFANAVNGLAFFPYLLPSISLSATFMLLSMKIKWLYALPFLTCVILGTLKYIPFASRSSLNAMMQLSGEIEEAAVIQNVPWWKRMVRIIFPIQKSAFLSGYLLPFTSCMRELSLFLFIGDNYMILTKFMFLLEDTGIAALENAANLILVVIILLVNWLVNLLTGASIDKGIGGK